VILARSGVGHRNEDTDRPVKTRVIDQRDVFHRDQRYRAVIFPRIVTHCISGFGGDLPEIVPV